MKVPLDQMEFALKAFERDSQSGAFGPRGTEHLDDTMEAWRALDNIFRNELRLPFDTQSSPEEFCAAFKDGDLYCKN